MFTVTGCLKLIYSFVQFASVLLIIPQTLSVFTSDSKVHHTVIFQAIMPPTSFASACYPGVSPYLCMSLFVFQGNEPIQAKKEDQ